MPHTIAVCGQKGGAGKTTLALSIASELLRRGARVLLVDADPQGTARTWADVAAERGRPAPSTIAMGATMHRPGQLDALADSFDIIVIDCPPADGAIQRSALMVADVALVPVAPSPSDVWSLGQTIQVAREAMAMRPALAVRLIINRADSRTAFGRRAAELLGDVGVELARSSLSQRVAYLDAMMAGEGVTTHQPRGRAAREVRALVDEIDSMMMEVRHVA